jgi:hypothetical protein
MWAMTFRVRARIHTEVSCCVTDRPGNSHCLQRLSKYGRNAIAREQVDSALVVFVHQFKNPLLLRSGQRERVVAPGRQV